MSPEQAKAILSIWPNHEDVTPAVKKTINTGILVEDTSAAECSMAKRRPNLDFHKMGIPNGSVLVSKTENSEEAEVISNRQVKFRGEEMSLTAATRIAKNVNYTNRPCPNWSYENRNLSEIYRETFPESLGERDEDSD